MEYKYNKENWSGEFNTLTVKGNIVIIDNVDNNPFTIKKEDNNIIGTGIFDAIYTLTDICGNKYTVLQDDEHFECHYPTLDIARCSKRHPAIALAKIIHNIH